MKLGYASVYKMWREMTSVEWLQWKAFMTLQPFHYDQERADVRAALIAMAIWNVQIAKSGSKSKASFRRIEEFLMKWGDSDSGKMFAKKPSERDKWAGLKLFAEAIGKGK